MNNFSNRFERLLEQFESAWRKSGFPDISEYVVVPEQSEISSDELFDFVELDLDYRWMRFDQDSAATRSSAAKEESGLSCFPEAAEYAARFPKLREQSVAGRLLICEYETRHRHGAGPELETFLSRAAEAFPREVVDYVAERLRQQQTIVAYDTKPTAALVPTISNYEIINEIASGGMGSVYLANQKHPVRRKVALKVIKTGADSEQIVTRFSAERQALAMMAHPNIAQIFDGGTTDDHAPFFVMEYVDGIPLAKYCDKHRLSVSERLQLFIPICLAVQHAHRKGIIHRDLKPSNVLVATHDGKPLPKVIDFGLAKALETDTKLTDETVMTEFGAIVGTIHYMSPEQAALDVYNVDSRTDIYSLGVMLYELLVGSTPLDRENSKNLPLLKVLEKIREEDPPKPSDRLRLTGDSLAEVADARQIESSRLKSILSGELDWVVMKALQKEPDRRYSTAEELAGELERFLQHRPVRARPVSLAYRLQKFGRRNRSQTVALFATLAVIGIASLLTPLWLRSRDDAAIAKLEQQLIVRPDELELTAEEWEIYQRQLTELKSLNPALAKEVEHKVVEQWMTAIDQRSRQPRLTEGRRRSLENALELIEVSAQSSDLSEQYSNMKQRLQRLQDRWSFVAAAEEPDAVEWSKVFRTGTFKIEEGNVHTEAIMTQPETWPEQIVYAQRRIPAAPLTTSQISCSGDTRVEVVFEEWQQAHEVGVTLNTTESNGYDFVLRASPIDDRSSPDFSPKPEAATLVSMQDSREKTGTYQIEIRRGIVPLLRHELKASDISDGPLKITALRDGSVMLIQLNNLPTRQILDPFPFRRSDEGLVGVRSLPDVELKSIRIDSKPITVESSLLTGDRFFAEEEFIAALDAFQGQAASAGADNSTVLEAEYKSAVCLLKLGRDDEASNKLADVYRSSHTTWAPLAAIALLEKAAVENDEAGQDKAFHMIQAMDAVERVASLMTEETRMRIVNPNLMPARMIDVLKYDPGRLPRVRRAAMFDRALSYDGRGSITAQTELSRVLRMEGEFGEARDILLDLRKRTDSSFVMRCLHRTLRLTGRADQSIKLIDEDLKANRYHPGILHLARARAFAVLGEYEQVRRDLDAALAANEEGVIPEVYLNTQIHLMRGFVLRRQGDEAAAKEEWRTGYLLGRCIFETVPNSTSSNVINVLVLGGLCGALTQDETQRFTEVALADAGGSGISGLIGSLKLSARIHRVLLRMWDSEFGSEWAEKIAFESIGLRDRAIGPAVVAGYEFISQGAFAGRPTLTESEVVKSYMRRAIQLMFTERKLTIPQAMQITSMWQGVALFGNTGLPANLPADFKADALFTIAHKRLLSGNAGEAKAFFEQVINMEGAAKTTAALAAETLQLIDAGHGRLHVRWEGNKPLQVRVLAQTGETVAESLLESTHSFQLPPGQYRLESSATPSATAVDVRIGRTSESSIQWNWSPSKKATSLPGLLSHPAEINAVSDWQIIQDDAGCQFADLAWNPDGTEVAYAGHDNVIHIVDVEQKSVIRQLCCGNSRILSLDWSPDGSLIAVGNMEGRVQCFDATTGQSMSDKHTCQYHGVGVRWSPKGTQLAVADAMKVVLLNTDAMAATNLKGHTGDAWVHQITWNDDGNLLATSALNEVIIWDLKTLAPRHVISGFLAVAFTDDPNVIVVASADKLALYDLSRGEVQKSVTVPSGRVMIDLAWLSSSKTVLCAGYNYNAIRWETVRDPEQVTLEPIGAIKIRLNPDQSLIAAGRWGGCRIHDAEFREFAEVGPTNGQLVHDSDCPSEDGGFTLVMTGGAAKAAAKIVHGNLSSGKYSISDQQPRARIVAWHPDRDLLAVGTYDGQIRILDAEFNQLAISHADQNQTEIGQLIWNADGSALFAADITGRIYRISLRVIATQSEPRIALGERTLITNHKQSLTVFAISPDESWLAVADGSRSVNVYSVKDGSLQQQLVCWNGSDPAISFSPEGNWLVSSGYNVTHVWDVAKGWQRRVCKDIGQIPNAYLWVGDSEVIYANNAGQLCQLSMDSLNMVELCQLTVHIRQLHRLSKNRILAVCQRGTVREINIESGKTLATAIARQEEGVAVFSAGGALLSNPETLDGLTVVQESESGQSSQPAGSFFQD